jgi:hypothetical protein
MKKVLVALMLAVLILPLAFAAPAYAALTLDGKVVIGENFTLKSGETITGDLVVISGSATVEDGAVVTGNAVVMGGSADLAGRVQQNVTVLGGSVTLRRSAVVEGQLAVLGGSITREEGAVVQGGESQGLGFNGNRDGGSLTPTPRVNPLDALDPLFWFVQNVIQAVGMVVVLTLLALVIVALWPDQTARVSAALTAAPAVSGLLGLLTLVAVPIVLGLLAITICLSPISLLGLVVYVAVILFGWVAFGQLLGNRLAGAFKWNLPPVGAAALGTFVITAVTALFWPFGPAVCLSWALATIFVCLGVGGVVLTRFGTTPYLAAGPSMPLRPVPPIPPPPPAPPMMPVAPVPPEPPAPPVAPDMTQFSPEPMAPAASEPLAPSEPLPPVASEPPAPPEAHPPLTEPPAI